MLNVLVIAYFLLFLFLAWKNFRLAVILFIIFLPTYLIRFQVGPLPSTVLELTFGALATAWLIKYDRQDFRKIFATMQKHKVLFVAFGLFFLSSVVSVLISDLFILSLGVWRAYFLEPMILFLILIGRMSSPSYQEGVGGVAEGAIAQIDLIWGLALSTVSISTYSILQKFTGWGIATPEWASEATRRVTAFFSSPNAVGLYLAPVLMLMIIPLLLRGGQGGVAEVETLQLSPATPLAPPLGKRRMTYALLATLFIFSLFAIVFTRSQGAWIGLGAGLLVFVFFLNYKKTVLAVAVVGIIFSLLIPSMRQAILFKDQAGQNRLRLLGYTEIFLSKTPANFILGTGLGEFFRKVQKPYYNDKIMERLIFPHSIFLNFWTETGLVGMSAMITMLGYVFYLANKIRKSSVLIGAGLMGVLTVLVVHGLVDVPYFKNDLSFLFWIIMAIPFYFYENIYQSQTDVV